MKTDPIEKADVISGTKITSLFERTQVGFFLFFIKGFNSLLGFCLGLLVAYTFGATEKTDALFIAMLIPVEIARSLPRMVDLSLVPSLVKGNAIEKKDLLSVFMGWWLFILLAICLILVLITPWLMSLMAPGLSETGKMEAVKLMRILLPSFILIGVFGPAQSFFHSHRKFYTPAFAQMIWRFTAMATLLTLGYSYGVSGYAVGLLLAALMQYSVIWLTGSHNGVNLSKIKIPSRNINPMKPIMKGAGVAYLALFLAYPSILIDRFFLSLMDEGSISLLYYADRLAKAVPILLATSFFSIFLPEISEVYTNLEKIRYIRKQICLLSLSIGMPIALLLFWSSDMLVESVLLHGKFDGGNVSTVARALSAFAVSIPALICGMSLKGVYIVSRNFKEILKISLFGLVVNAVADLLLYRLGVWGIALAFSISMYSICIYLLIKADIGWHLTKAYGRVFGGGLYIGAVLYFLPWRNIALPDPYILIIASTVSLVGYLFFTYPLFKKIKVG